MRPYKHLEDSDLSRRLTAAAAEERSQLAKLLAYMAEFDRRKLFRPAGYPSMYDYCVRVLGFSEDMTYKRIRAVRAARQFPEVLPALADGRLTLTAVVLLRPYLTRSNVSELIAAAAGKTKLEIQRVIAERFPRPDAPTEIRTVLPAMACACQLVPEPVVSGAEVASSHDSAGSAPAEISLTSRIEPLAPRRVALQVTIDETTYQKLRRAQELLSHALPSGDVAQVLDRALELLVTQLEKRKYGTTAKPRPTQRTSRDPRYIPKHVRRAVRERDGEQCTYVSPEGHRCEARKFLEFDHIQEVARSGQPTLENLRLRCRAHNQLTAEHTYGAEYVETKRRQSAEARSTAAREPKKSKRAKELRDDMTRDLATGLATLGYRKPQIREAIASCTTNPGATLEDRMRAALAFLRPRATQISFRGCAEAHA